MSKKTEYLITHYNRDGSIRRQLRAPKSVSIRVLLERLICQNLDEEAVIASCLRTSSKRFWDPFQVIDLRDEHRREQATLALGSNPQTPDPIGVYNRARQARIPLGKALLIAGSDHDYFVTEVEIATLTDA